MSKPTFLKVATRPKWVGALVLALAVAAVFALLAQWQADRSFRYVPKTPTDQTLVKLEDIAETSSPFLTTQADRLVSVVASVDHCFVVSNRIQLDGKGGSKTGFWVVHTATTSGMKFIALATGWFATATEASDYCINVPKSFDPAAPVTFTGIYEPSEEARVSNGIFFESLSIEQLINQPDLPDRVDAYAGFIIVKEPAAVGEPIVIGNNPGENVFNWLTAFYAIEWTLFAGFAVFLWARMVKDEVIRESAEGRIE